MVVNELAAEQMGFSNPAEAIGKQVRLNQFGLEIGMLPATIVGVVENSRFRSLRDPVEAMMFYDRGIYWNLSVSYDSHDPEAVRQKIGDIWQRHARAGTSERLDESWLGKEWGRP